MVPSFRLRLICRHFFTYRMGDMASKAQMPTPEEALPGRTDSIKISIKHDVNGNRTVPPFPEGTETAMFGMGCFWGAERKFWRQKGVYSTQVGYAGGFTPNPTYNEVCSGMRQGNDAGTTYRSAIYTSTQQQLEEALASKDQYQKVLTEEGFGPITTEVSDGKQFYYAEDYHQQYLSKNPNGYCGLGGTGVSCPIGIKNRP
ncbi:mitochondrial peptide methionine sulfoxide reductase isoform 2-T2 [Aulostomus maculatus]